MNRSKKLGGLLLVVISVLAAGMTAALAATAPALASTSPGSGASVQSALTVSATYDQALFVTSTLVVTDTNDEQVLGATTFSLDERTIVFTPAPLSEGTYVATATVRNSSGQETVTVWSFSIDTAAPAVPAISSVDGDSATPATGNDSTPTIVVTGVVAGDTVRVFDGDLERGSMVVPPSTTTVTFNAGSATNAPLVAGDGNHSLTATSTDPAGNPSDASAAFVYTLDTAAPGAPTINSIAGDSTTPAMGNDPTPPIVVSGVIAGDTVSIVDGTTVMDSKVVPALATSVTFNSGTTPDFTLTDDGNHTFTAVAADPVGNASPSSPGFLYTLETGAPDAPTITSVDGDTTSPAVGTDPSPIIVVSGVVAGDTVRILEGDTERGVKVVPADADSVTFNAAAADTEVVLTSDGSHSLTATATDPSGNLSAPSAAFVYGLTTTFPGEFHELTPARVLDTRNGTGGFSAPVGPAGTIAVPVAGKGGVPATGASAVVLNVTITQPTADTFLTVFPSGTTRPLASNLNALPGKTVPNLVIAKLGADGKVAVYNNVGTSHVIYDVMGWFSDTTGANGARYSSLTPARILDTRTGTGGFNAAVGAGGTISADVTGVGGVPATGVSAVVLNVTATQPTAGESFLTVFPSGGARPLASNLNFVAGQTVPNLVMAKVGADGKVSVYNNLGTSHVIFDVVGWFGSDADTAGARYNALSPARILDTRTGNGGFSAPVGPAATISPKVTGVGGVPATGVTAVVLNVTVTQPTAAESFLTVFPAGAARPLASNLNFLAGQTVPNLVMAKVGADGKVSVFNNLGTSHVIFDVVGWYSE